MKRRTRFTAAVLAGLMLLSSTGCGGGSNQTSTTAGQTGQSTAEATKAAEGDTTGQAEKLPPLKLSIMLPYGNNEHDNEELTQRFQKDIQDYTNTEIEWIWYELDMYTEKQTLLFASGDLPSIMVSSKKAEFINAVKNDAFWNVTDYVKDYENLSQITEAVFLNASINGELWGVPRSRTLGRNGVGYRLDWLNNLGLKEPETLDEFYDMLVAFTNNDPDGNGVNDTYGMAVSMYEGPWDAMQLWFGAPNKWGIDENGNLIPDFLTEEYDTALKWFRKIYSEGLVNPDFATYPAADWDVMLRGGQAGAAVDVLDRFRRNQDYFTREGIPAETMLTGAIDAGQGLRCMPTAGYADLLVISKSKVKTEEDMKRALQFLDDLGDSDLLKIMEFGYEGISYYMDEDGFPVYYTNEEKEALGVPAYDFRKGYNQLLSYWQSPEEAAKRFKVAPYTEEIRLLEEKLYTENEQYCIPNYGASYISDTYVAVGAELDTIIRDARLNYIQGLIDDVGLQEAKEQWKRSGGEDVIKEMNELYHAAGN